MNERVFAFVALTACSPATRPPASPKAEVPADALPTATAERPPTRAPSHLSALPKPPRLARAAMKVVGYPASISTGMNDPAHIVGFTADGDEYGYCATLSAPEPATTTCTSVRRDGTRTRRSTDDASHEYSKVLADDLAAWIRTSGMATIPMTADFTQRLARPVVGSWDFSDITVWVHPIAGDGVKTNALLRIGGAVDGEAPVYPVTLSAKARAMLFSAVWTNDLSLSRDEGELGVVGGFFCMEWCNEFEVHRQRVNAFASQIYNDTGFRRHAKGDYARAASLFLAATWADESAKLPPYNLACAWARLGDPRAKDALVVAMERDPSAKARASADEDFANVRREDWFIELTTRP